MINKPPPNTNPPPKKVPTLQIIIWKGNLFFTCDLDMISKKKELMKISCSLRRDYP
jgi:hypothetical protein